ncbi:RES family NAD+ phosphorylase [Mesoterricola sediminis]|uniref:RES domain-containing protein n=1 Tax=Mesoterricola sediminis TaxID=2927980 RepID=A0AA48KDN2_9BACT|nr:RES family NAD+ phosphorylase [Mesoterricola sediminis]BDU76507.1 hypothetical protein METESE_14650 [Mesoterricola sediminis]
MAKFPEPPTPGELALLGPDVQILPAGSTVWRIYFLGGSHPTSWGQFRAWGPTESRFDHHIPPASLQAREILYGAVGPRGAITALADVFQETRIVDRSFNNPCLASFETIRDLRLLDLTGTWPTKAGASAAIASGPKARARRWSQAIFAAFPSLDGLLYGSSMHANAPCVALYERAAVAMPASPSTNRMLADPILLTALRNACADLNFFLV